MAAYPASISKLQFISWDLFKVLFSYEIERTWALWGRSSRGLGGSFEPPKLKQLMSKTCRNNYKINTVNFKYNKFINKLSLSCSIKPVTSADSEQANRPLSDHDNGKTVRLDYDVHLLGKACWLRSCCSAFCGKIPLKNASCWSCLWRNTKIIEKKIKYSVFASFLRRFVIFLCKKNDTFTLKKEISKHADFALGWRKSHFPSNPLC